MKKEFLLTAALTLCGISHANVLEINSRDRTLFVHPTPRAEVTLLDLQSEGGYLSVFLDYSSEGSQEIDSLQAQYPDYEIKVVVANADGNLSVEIPDINFSKSILERQGQMGPYVNAQFDLTVAQTKALKSRQSSIKDLIKLSVPAAGNFMSSTLVESFKSSPASCDALTGNNVATLLRSLNSLQRPRAIQIEDTYFRFKEELLDRCFEVNTAGTHSFSQLFSSSVRRLYPREDIVVETYKRKSKSLKFSIEPRIDFKVVGE